MKLIFELIHCIFGPFGYRKQHCNINASACRTGPVLIELEPRTERFRLDKNAENGHLSEK